MTAGTAPFRTTGVSRGAATTYDDVQIASVQDPPLTAWDRLISELESYRDLRPDWDGAGGMPPDPKCVSRGIRLIESMRGSGDAVAPSAVSPGVNGEILLVWEVEGCYIELEVPSSGNVHWTRVTDGRTEHGETSDWLNCHVSRTPRR